MFKTEPGQDPSLLEFRRPERLLLARFAFIRLSIDQQGPQPVKLFRI